MIYDLHTHTDCSDGKLAPMDMIERAIDNQVDVLSITDHDTLAAYAELPTLPKLRLITGIELSTCWRKANIHIVGLNIDLNSPAMQAMIENQIRRRDQRAEKILKRLSSKLNTVLDIDEVREKINTNVIGRPHIANHLVDLGLVKNHTQAFDKYLGRGKIGDIKQDWPELETTIQCILDSGGIAVIAHPMKYAFTRTKLKECLQDFKTLGGQAVEIISGRQTSDITRDILKMTNSMKLYASCGSDFHQPGQPWAELGSFGALPNTAKPVWDLF